MRARAGRGPRPFGRHRGSRAEPFALDERVGAEVHARDRHVHAAVQDAEHDRKRERLDEELPETSSASGASGKRRAAR